MYNSGWAIFLYLKFGQSDQIKDFSEAFYLIHVQVDTTFYPWDTQTCKLKFASWTDEISRVSFWLERVCFGAYYKHRLFYELLLQINMSIGSIDETDILALYTPSGKTHIMLSSDLNNTAQI